MDSTAPSLDSETLHWRKTRPKKIDTGKPPSQKNQIIRAWLSWILGIFSILISCAALGTQHTAWSLDKSYPVYRVAEILRAGGGWAYNSGGIIKEHLSVAHTLLVTGVGFFVESLPAAVHLVGLGSLILIGVASFQLFWRIVPALFALPASLALAACAAGNGTWGVETSLLLGLLTLYLLREEQRSPPWLVLSLLVMTRVELVIVLGLRLVVEGVRRQRMPWRPLAVSLLALTPLLAFRQLVLGGERILNSYFWWPEALYGLFQGTSVFDAVPTYAFEGLGPLPVFTALLAVFGAGLAILKKRRESIGLLVLSLLMVAYCLIYTFIPNPLPIQGLAIVEFGIVLFAWYGVGRLTNAVRLGSFVQHSSLITLTFTAFLLAGAVLSLLHNLASPLAHHQRAEEYLRSTVVLTEEMKG